MNFLRRNNIFRTFFPIYRLNGNSFIPYHVQFQLTPIYVCSNINYGTPFYILKKSFLFLIKKILLWLYVIIMSRTRFRVISHSMIACISRNVLLNIWIISDSNGIQTHNHLVCEQTLANGWVFVYEVSSFGFESRCCHLCSYCRLQNETTNHIFVECKFVIGLWSNMRDYCQCSFELLILNPHSATFGFFEIYPNLFTFLNHIMLLYKYYIYSLRNFSKLSFAALLKILRKFLIWKKSIDRKSAVD